MIVENDSFFENDCLMGDNIEEASLEYFDHENLSHIASTHVSELKKCDFWQTH